MIQDGYPFLASLASLGMAGASLYFGDRLTAAVWVGVAGYFLTSSIRTGR